MIYYDELAIISEKTMRSPEMGPGAEQSPLVERISGRAGLASEKIQQRVNEIFIPKINGFGSLANRWLQEIQNDFYSLAKNPNAPCGGGQYKGWTTNEIQELYSVVYGEKM